MSYFIPNKLRITPTQIIMKGGDNNVFPRENLDYIIDRNEKEDINFCRLILGGCIQPIQSIDKGFWKWLRMKLRDEFKWNKPELISDKFWQMVNDRHKEKGKYIIQLYEVNVPTWQECGYFKNLTSKAMHFSRRRDGAKILSLYQAETVMNKDWIRERYPNMKMIKIE